MAEANMVSKKKEDTPFFAYSCAVLGSMTSVISGYDTGVMTGAQIFIKKDLDISDEKLELLVGLINIYSLIGAAMAGKISDWFGRRSTILIAAIVFFIGSLLMGFAVNYEMLMAGRFLAGIGVGFGLVSAPVYTTELAPSTSRGLLASFPEVFINFGVLLGYISNLSFSHLSLKFTWRVMLGIGAAPCVLMVIMLLIMPESPRWLVMKGRLAEAKAVLLKTSSSKEVALERLQGIKEAVGIPLDCDDDVYDVPKREKGNEAWRELLIHPTPTIRRIFIAAIGIQFFQQASGIDAVVLYSTRIFEKAGIKGQTHVLVATIGVGLVKTTLIAVSTLFLDRWGRRPVLLISVGGMIVSVLLLTFGLFTIQQNGDKEVQWAIGLSMAMVYIYVGFFSSGLGPIAWVYSSEIYPLRLRGIGSSLGAATNRLISGIIGISFLSMVKAMTTAGSFLFFGGICTVAFIFFALFLPETKGRSLEDMNSLFSNSRFSRAANVEEPKEPKEEKANLTNNGVASQQN